jgi:hypothetical protein
MGLRLWAPAALLAGVLIAVQMESPSPSLLVPGLGLYAAGVIYDFATVGDAVDRKWQRDHTIQPVPLTVSHGIGLGLAGRF